MKTVQLSWSRKKFFFLNFGLILIATCLTLLIGEGILQLFYLNQNGHWLKEDDAFHITYTIPVNDRRQYKLRPNYTDPEAGLTIDELGFRYTSSIKQGNKIVVSLGDSVPFGANVKDDQTYPAQLNRIFTETQTNVRVLNTGSPSYNLRQSFDRLHFDVLPHYPFSQISLIIIHGTNNDISLFTHYESEWTPDVTWARDLNWIPLRPEWQKSATLFYLTRVVEEISGNKNVRRQPGAPENKIYDGTPMLNHIEQILRQELTIYQSHSIPVIILPLNPFFYQLENREKNPQLNRWSYYSQFMEGWDELTIQYNDVLLKVSQEFDNAYFLDTRPLMDATDRDEMYLDFVHHTPEGNKVLAKALFEFISENQLIPIN